MTLALAAPPVEVKAAQGILDRSEADAYLSRPLIRGVTYASETGPVFLSLCELEDHACRLFRAEPGARDLAAVTPAVGPLSAGYTWPRLSADGARLLAVKSPSTLKAERAETIVQTIVEIDLRTGAEKALVQHAGLLFSPAYAGAGAIAFFRSDRLAPVRGCRRERCVQAPTSLSLVLRGVDGEQAMLDGFDAAANGGDLLAAGRDLLFAQGWSTAPSPTARKLRFVLVEGRSLRIDEFPTGDAAADALRTRVDAPPAWSGRLGESRFRPAQAPFLSTVGILSFGTNTAVLSSGSAAYAVKSSQDKRKITLFHLREETSGWRSTSSESFHIPR